MNAPHDLLLLNIGAGSHKLPGFINVDIEPGADVVADITRGLPFDPGTVDGIYSEHFIEHITQGDGCFFFRESRRVLRPGGVIRVATPDLDAIVASFNAGGTDSMQHRNTWLHPEWERFGFEWITTRAEMMNTALREWGHQWVYNEEELVRLATFCGLKFRGRFALGESRIPWFKDLEHRESSNLVLEFEREVRRPFGGSPLVSICIPAYNPGHFDETMQCALSQTYPNIEIIISDDCRSEAIRDLSEKYLSDPRVRYVKNPVPGGDPNYLNAISEARGPYIKLYNDDDIIEPNCVEKLVEAAEKFPDATLITSVREQFWANRRRIPQSGPFKPIYHSSAWIDSSLVRHLLLEKKVNFLGEPNCALFRKADALSIFPNILTLGGQRNVMGSPGDVVMWMNLLSQGDLVYLVDHLSFLRSHEGQIQRGPDYEAQGNAAWNRMAGQAVRLGLHKQSAHGYRRIKTIRETVFENDDEAWEIFDLTEQGQLGPASKKLQAYMQIHPNSENSMILLGDLLFKTGKKAEAMETWSTGLMQYKTSLPLARRILLHSKEQVPTPPAS